MLSNQNTLRKKELDGKSKLSERGRWLSGESTHGSSMRTEVWIPSNHIKSGCGSRYLQPQGWVERVAEIGGFPELTG